MRRYPLLSRTLVTLALLTIVSDLPCRASPTDTEGQGASRIDQVCPLVVSAAQANRLPVGFFVRLIWRESHFRPKVVGPATANGQRAEGIAQFMPATATEHKLSEPFNPSAALPKSGEFLAELRDQFGNLGLAAAAYNAGPHRVRDYLSGNKSLPAETRNYVLAITGRSVEEWTKAALPPANKPNSAQPVGANTEAVDNPEPVATCRDLIPHLDQASTHLPLQRQSALRLERQTSRVSLEPQTNRVFRETPNRRVPVWCSGLRHPNVALCGNVHIREPATKTGELPSHSVLHRSISHVHLPRVSLGSVNRIGP